MKCYTFTGGNATQGCVTRAGGCCWIRTKVAVSSKILFLHTSCTSYALQHLLGEYVSAALDFFVSILLGEVRSRFSFSGLKSRFSQIGVLNGSMVESVPCTCISQQTPLFFRTAAAPAAGLWHTPHRKQPGPTTHTYMLLLLL